MTIDDALAAIADATAELPVEAMQALLDGWGEAAARCRCLLHGYVCGDDLSEATERALFTIVHLLGEKADTAAFVDLCALAADPERADLILGDALTETFPCILIGTYAGDPAPLRALVEGTTHDDVLRGTALLVLAYLTHSRRIPKAEMHAMLAGWYETLQPRGQSHVWFGWVMAVGLLGFGALAGKVATVFERGFLDPMLMDLAHFRADLKFAAENPAATDGFDDLAIGPMGCAIQTLEGWSAEEEPPPPAPFVHAAPKVGRNDPCPCGSGRKYKKCCLI